MAAQRLFKSKLNAMLDAIHEDFMNESGVADPAYFAVELFNRVTNDVDVDLMITKDGHQIEVNFLFNRNVGYSMDVHWNITLDPTKVDRSFNKLLARLKSNSNTNPELLYSNRTVFPGYFCRFEWNAFRAIILDTCIEFNAEAFGQVSVAKCELGCSMFARFAYPMVVPNMAEYV
jgi:hypothetical protein